MTTPEPLDYSGPPSRRPHVRLTRGRVAGLGVLLVALCIFLRGGPLTSADVGLDTGDLRYRYLGVPLSYDRTPEPQRSWLLALAAGSKVLRPEWHTCATFPKVGSNNPDRMCRGWYFQAGVWAAEDPQLARLMVEDVAGHVAATDAAHGLPDSSLLLSRSYVEPTADGRWAVRPGWRQDDDVQAYMRAKGYSPPATAPSR